MITSVSPHGFTTDATSAALEHDIRTWLFHSGIGVGEGASTLTYLRVVVQPEATAADGCEVESATTGTAPVWLSQHAYTVRDPIETAWCRGRGRREQNYRMGTGQC